jgi:PAS domain S-box-containing protein
VIRALLFRILSTKERIVFTTVLTIGLVLTTALMFETFREIERHEHAIFVEDRNRIRDSLADQMRAAAESLQNIAVLFTVSATEVDSDGFRMIAETTMAQQRAVRYISFARWVPAFRKEAFEERNWRASGVAQFKIHSLSESVEPPKYYLPIVHLEPLTPGTISLLGFDIWSYEKFRNHIQRAIDSGKTVVSEAVVDSNAKGFNLVKAVYTGRTFPPTVEQRQKSVLGILRVMMSSPELIANLRKYENFHVRLTAKGSKVVVEKFPEESHSHFLEKKLWTDLPLEIGDVQYGLHIEKNVPFTPMLAGIYLLVFLFGFSLSLLVANRIAALIRSQREILERQAEIELKVEEKTRALQQSEILLRQVINSNPNIIFAQARDKRILFANQKFFQVFGLSEAEVYQQLLPITLPGQDIEQGSWEEQIFLANGQAVWLETHRVNIELENHGLCTLVVAVDISQRKADNAVIADQRAKMVTSAKLSAIGEMAGGLAHEINTPLTTLQLCSDFIATAVKARVPDLRSIEEQNAMIAKTTERIGRIVSGLRAFSKDGSQDEMTKFCLTQAIENTLALCREKFRHSAIRLEWQSPGSVEVVGREIQISQVILNLLNNSFDAVQEASNAWIRIHLNLTERNVEIFVEDNGNGVSKEAKEKLFQPFFTTKESGKGTGLGLSISRGIIENHAGQLRLDQSVAFTRFVIVLPLTRPILQPVPPQKEQGGLL